MFDDFASTYIDKEGFLHLYLFYGIDENGQPISKPVSFDNLINANIEYSVMEIINGVDIIFSNKKLRKISCKLINKNTNKEKSFNFTVKK